MGGSGGIQGTVSVTEKSLDSSGGARIRANVRMDLGWTCGVMESLREEQLEPKPSASFMWLIGMPLPCLTTRGVFLEKLNQEPPDGMGWDRGEETP